MGWRQWRKDKCTTALFMQKWEKFHSTVRKSLNLWGYFYKFRKIFITQRDRVCQKNIIACKILHSSVPGSDHNYSGSIGSLFMWRTVGKQKIDQTLSKCVHPNHSPSFSSGVVLEQILTNQSRMRYISSATSWGDIKVRNLSWKSWPLSFS